MRRLSLWMRAHPMAGDSVIAVVLLLADLLIFVAAVETPELPMSPWYVALPLDVAMVLPLLFRRKSPLWSAYLVLAIGIPHAILELGLASAIGMGISIYSVLVYVGRRQGLLYLLATVVVSAVEITLDPPDEDLWIIVILATFSMALCWTLGEFVGARRAYHEEVEARLHLLEMERDQATRIAVAQERGRIARELHDVVAHAVSVMVVQADGASYAVDGNPEMAKRALQTISETGRGALAELRRLLDVLRNDGDDEPRVPQPDANALTDLAERIRQAGVPVSLVLDADAVAGLPAGVSLGVYRIVQESLTNTLKHAGHGAQAEVRVRREADMIDVVIADDGAGRTRTLVPATRTGSPAQPGGPRRLAVPGGNGLIGMRERANVFGGTLEVGPVAGGGWQVHARLPVRLAS